MWFRNLLVYRLTQDIDFGDLEAALAAKPARSPGSQELATYGFTAPIGKGENAPLVHESSGFLLISARKEERMLPGGVIKDAVTEKVNQIEAEQLRKVYKKEREQIKDEIVQEYLPRAFVRKKTTSAMIMPADGLIVVDAYSPRNAEDLLSTLREAMGSLPVRPVTVKIAPSATLTDWVKQQQSATDFHVLDQALLKDTHEDGGSINAKRQDLTSEEIQLHVSSGKQVTQLSLAWQDKLSFIVDDHLSIKRLKFEDLLQEQAEQDGGDDALSQLDASFVLMGLTLRQFLPALFEAFGGEDQPQGLGESNGYESRLEARPAIRRPERQVDLQEAIDSSPEGVGSISGDENDALYTESVKFVTQSRRVSISMIQRKFKIGYNRAARLVETLELNGVVTPMNTNGSREVIAHV